MSGKLGRNLHVCLTCKDASSPSHSPEITCFLTNRFGKTGIRRITKEMCRQVYAKPTTSIVPTTITTITALLNLARLPRSAAPQPGQMPASSPTADCLGLPRAEPQSPQHTGALLLPHCWIPLPTPLREPGKARHFLAAGVLRALTLTWR